MTAISRTRWSWDRAFDPQRRTASLLGLLIAAKVVLLFVLAWNTRFVMDEFVQLGWAKFVDDQLYVTNWPVKAVGFALFYKLAHWVGWDAQSILLIGRLQTALLACGTLALVSGCARALGKERPQALAIVVILLSFSNFMERIFRTIAEPLAVFFAAASLLVVLRGQGKPRAILLAGFLTGLAFLSTQKSIYFNVALGFALVGSAMLALRPVRALVQGALLVAGWLVAIAAYCILFGGTDAASIARHMFFAPVENAVHGADPYGSLRHFVLQTLTRNALLYSFCFTGLAVSVLRIRRLDEPARIALIFTIFITAFVFAHSQPWPYVFVMALPFLALWSLEPFEFTGRRPIYRTAAAALMITAIVVSLVANLLYLRHGNRRQLELVARAESLLEANQPYFDGVGMLPTRPEASGVWLDRNAVQQTLREGANSAAYRMFEESPPKLLIWSYRMDAIESVVGDRIRAGYVRVSPNLWLAGRRLMLGRPVEFTAPAPGTYRLYGEDGEPVEGRVVVDGVVQSSPLRLDAGPATVTLRAGPPGPLLLLPAGSYAGRFTAGPDNSALFAGVYD
jgi:hypothetical protein